MNEIVAAIEKISNSLDLHTGIEGIEVLNSAGDIIYKKRWCQDYPRDIYSNTKSFTNAAVGMAILENKLNLHSRVIDFFEGPLNGNKEYWNKLKLIDLLTMKSGFDNAHLMYFDRRKGVGANDYVDYMMKQRLEWQPGTRFLYSSGDAILAGCMVEKAVEMPLLEYLYKGNTAQKTVLFFLFYWKQIGKYGIIVT